MDDLLACSAVRLAAAIRDRAISPVELVQASLERAAIVQPALNPFSLLDPEGALAASREAEAAVMRGHSLAPLHGLPVALKDLTPTRGLLTTRGSRVFADWRPEHSAVVALRLQAAGAILLGKTTTPELAHAGFTRSPLWGHTRNPWDPTRTCGGSSGGSAVAVATGCVALAEGTDMGGSVRIPAALCGVVGLKPSLGRVPMDILPSVFDTFSHFGPLARTVEDAALFLAATEGPDDSDIQSQMRPTPLPARLDGDVRGLRIALSRDLGFYAVEPAVLANLDASARALEGEGASIEEVALPWTPAIVEGWVTAWGVFMAAFFGDMLASHRAEMDPELVALMDAGMRVDAVTLRRLEILRTEQWRSLAAIFRRCDVLLCPTMARTAPDLHASDSDFEALDGAGRLVGYDMTAPFNHVGVCPALSVPSGFDADGLPTAVQIVGRRFDDPTVLEVGRALERARPWPVWTPRPTGA